MSFRALMAIGPRQRGWPAVGLGLGLLVGATQAAWSQAGDPADPLPPGTVADPRGIEATQLLIDAKAATWCSPTGPRYAEP